MPALSGVARGKMPEDDVQALHTRVAELIKQTANGAVIDANGDLEAVMATGGQDEIGFELGDRIVVVLVDNRMACWSMLVVAEEAVSRLETDSSSSSSGSGGRH